MSKAGLTDVPIETPERPPAVGNDLTNIAKPAPSPADTAAIPLQNSSPPSTSATDQSRPKVDVICSDLLAELFPGGGAAVWKSTTIFELKTIFETQQRIVTKYGLYHNNALSTPLLIRIVTDLISQGAAFFTHHDSRTYFNLELHLRCIVTGLRLLCAHGMEERTGSISFSAFDGLYNQMNWWRTFHLEQVAFDKRKSKHEKVRNYNNEFLIVYIRDLISSIPSEQTMASNVAKRMMATAAALGHAYSKNLVQSALSLKTAVQRKYPPSPWHSKYRTMDDLCSSVRLLQESLSTGSSKEQIDHDLMLETEQSVAGQLTEILLEEVQEMSSFGGDKVGAAVRLGGDSMGSAPLARKGHFVYGILDLLQHHVSAMLCGKFDKTVVDLSLRVVEVSKYSFLRCKAFEVLATFSTKHGVGQMPIKSMNEILQRRDIWPSVGREKVAEQWRVIRTKVLVDDEHMTAELRRNLPDRVLILDPEEPIMSVSSILMAQENEYKEKERVLSLQISKLKYDLGKTRSGNNMLNKKIDEFQQEITALKKTLQLPTSRFQNSREENDMLSEDTRKLHQEMSSPQKPLREDKYYILEFCQIGMDVESWAAKETRKMSKQPLSKADWLLLFNELYRCGEHGIKAAEGFKAKTKIFQHRRYRIMLIRHVMAFILFDRIFNVFMFGCKRDYSECFKKFEEHVCLDENLSLAKMLTIRQTLGETINAQTEDVAAFRSSVIQTLVLLMHSILPVIPPEIIPSFVIKMVDKSISLRTEMTEEQAVYRCYFVDYGSPYDNSIMEAASGEKPVGKVTMCTFPGLSRFTLVNGKKVFDIVVKATVNLNTAS